MWVEEGGHLPLQCQRQVAVGEGGGGNGGGGGLADGGSGRRRRGSKDEGVWTLAPRGGCRHACALGKKDVL